MSLTSHVYIKKNPSSEQGSYNKSDTSVEKKTELSEQELTIGGFPISEEIKRRRNEFLNGNSLFDNNKELQEEIKIAAEKASKELSSLAVKAEDTINEIKQDASQVMETNDHDKNQNTNSDSIEDISFKKATKAKSNLSEKADDVKNLIKKEKAVISDKEETKEIMDNEDTNLLARVEQSVQKVGETLLQVDKDNNISGRASEVVGDLKTMVGNSVSIAHQVVDDLKTVGLSEAISKQIESTEKEKERQSLGSTIASFFNFSESTEKAEPNKDDVQQTPVVSPRI